MKIRRLAAILAVLSLGCFAAILLAQDRVPGGDASDRGRHARFDARDREVAGEWYRASRVSLPAGFREQDRPTPEWESKLRVDEALDSELRGRIVPAPVELVQKLPPPLGDYQYVALDGHLLLVDERTWNVSDVLHFELDFGRP
jgi:hypothetical protein